MIITQTKTSINSNIKSNNDYLNSDIQSINSNSNYNNYINSQIGSNNQSNYSEIVFPTGRISKYNGLDSNSLPEEFINSNQNNNKKSEYQLFSFIKIIGNHKNNINKQKDNAHNNSDNQFIIKKKSIYTADSILKLDNSILSYGTNNVLNLYDKFYKEKKRIIELKGNYINNICKTSNTIIICLNDSLMIYDLEKLLNNKNNYNKKSFKDTNIIFLLEIKEDEYIISYEKKIIQYLNIFKNIIGETCNEYHEIQYIKSGLKINNNCIVLKECNISREKNGLFFNRKIINEKFETFNYIKAKNYSFIYSINGLALIPREENKSKNKILLCACKKYLKNQKNGILVVNIELNDNIIIRKYHLYNTKEFEVYCLCQIKNINNENILNNIGEYTDYFLVGGFNKRKKKGIIKLYKVIFDNNNFNNKIEYIEDIFIDNNNNFKGFKGPISCIVQDNSGNFIITCWDGNVLLFSLKNLDYYLKFDEKNKNNISKILKKINK